MKRIRKRPVPLAFHGIAIRSRDPKKTARRLRELLGWSVLSRTRREVVLGAGPELFLAIRTSPPDASESERVDEIHLAVKEIGRSRRRTEKDPLGGDSWIAEILPSLTLVSREFRRAPSPRWRRKRRR